MSLYDWLQAGGGAALLLMTLVQIAPIKVNPWSAVARGIGKTMNKDMTLHSTMFLLIQNTETRSWTVLHFTFHNVSINTGMAD